MRKDIYAFTLFVLGMCSACSSEDMGSGSPDRREGTPVLFSGSVAGSRTDGETGAKEDDDPWHNHFVLDWARIRVVNTVNYSVPDFENSYYEYVFKNDEIVGSPEWDDVDEPNFFPWKPDTEAEVDYDRGFKWEDMIPTSGAYVFEAVCYSMIFKPFTEVYTDQTTEFKFWSADLLLAHHAMPLSDIYSLVKLRFWHVFAMVRVQVTLPVADPEDDYGFKGDAVDKVKLNGMLTGYTVNYANAIENNGLRTVSASGDKREDISMYKLSEVDNGDDTRTYEYAAIVPVQEIRGTENLVSLDIKTITGVEQDAGGQWVQHEELKHYVFKPSSSIEMQQAHMTILQLKIDSEDSVPVLLNAEIVPWQDAYTEVTLTPKQEDSGDTN